MVYGKLKSHVFVFCPFSWSVTSLSFLLWLKISGCVFRSCFACLWSCSFVRLLKISGCVFCFWVLLFCQVAKFFRLWFFSVSFFFLRLCLSFLFLFFFSVCDFLFFWFSSLRLWFSLSGCGFIFFVLFSFQAVVLVLFSCLVSFALVRLCSLVLCLLSLSGGSGRTTCFFGRGCYNFQAVLLVFCLLFFSCCV